MLDDGKILRQKDGVLTTTDPRTKATLPDVIAAARDGDAAVGVNGISVPLSWPPAEPWLAHILPLTSGARRHAGIEYSAVAAVFVHQASLETPSSMETLSKLYKLTPSELRVLAAVSEVGGVSAVAEVVGITEATVKTHLQHLFAKTGTNRQTDLVKLVATHASPLRKTPCEPRAVAVVRSRVHLPRSAAIRHLLNRTVDAVIRPFFQKFLRIVSEGGLLGSMGAKNLSS
jgi:DNA-binding CsgD family transcriptional regulator